MGPMDPEIGVLRVDRNDGRPLAVVFNFAGHPYGGVPSGGVTADFPGFACRVIEEALGHGVVALFLQGAAGDITPIAAVCPTSCSLETHELQSVDTPLQLRQRPFPA
jgi:hypothetical protein